MKVVLVGINSRFSHTMLSVRCLASYARAQGTDCMIREYTINNQAESIVQSLYFEKADIFAFSCYIFNIRQVEDVASSLRKLLPEACFVFGGPEVGYGAEDFLRGHPYADFVLTGEGEESFAEFVRDYDSVPGQKKRYCENKRKGCAFLYDGKFEFPGFGDVALDLDRFPFPYGDELPKLKDRILYYESSRGCPYRCSYCLSSIDKSVRFRSLAKVFGELKLFLDAGVRLVKFVDRTFNCDNARALEIMKFLAENDNGITEFHFEVAVWRFGEDVFRFLESVPRKDLFRFEVGIQSTNPETLRAIGRSADVRTVLDKTRQLVKTGFHVHADLICGLPYENLSSFARSFDEVYSLGAECLQLGFLKVLRGAPIAGQHEHGNVFSDIPPYEILYNNYISYDDIVRLKRIEELVELYYNSGLCSFLSAGILETRFGKTPFAFYDGFAEALLHCGFFDGAHRTVELFDYIYKYIRTLGVPDTEVEALCGFDFYRFGKPGAFPEWLSVRPDKELHRMLMSDAGGLGRLAEELPEGFSVGHRNSEVATFRTGDKEMTYLFLYGARHKVVTIVERSHNQPLCGSQSCYNKK